VSLEALQIKTVSEGLSVVRGSRLLYGTSDFYSSSDPEQLCRQFEQVLFELLGQSDFTVFYLEKTGARLQSIYSTNSRGSKDHSSILELENPAIKAIVNTYHATGMLLNDDPTLLQHLPFPARYCSLIRDDNTFRGLLVIHQGINESIYDSFPILELLEPIVKHFTLALLHVQEMEEAEKNLDEANARLIAINDMGELLGQLNLDPLLSKIMSFALQLTKAEVGNLMIFEKNKLQTRVEWGLSDEIVMGISLQAGGALVDEVFEKQIPVLVQNLQTDARFAPNPLSRQIHSIVSIPLCTKDKTLGVLNVVNTREGESFSSLNMITLQTVAGLASVAIDNAMLHREAIQRKVMEEQLRIARQIWENIMPRNIPAFSVASICARSVPATVIGGDFYDFIPLGEDRLGLVIADVSGKGIPAAMSMNMVKGILHIEAAKNHPPNEMLKIVNNLLIESARLEGFITLIYAVVDRTTRRISLTNAGHNPCLLYRQATRQCEEISSQNVPLAVEPDQTFSNEEVLIQTGDCLVLYTDGMTEARNQSQEMFGSDRLRQLLEEVGHLQAADVITERIYDGVKDFMGETAQHDDMTVVVLKVIG